MESNSSSYNPAPKEININSLKPIVQQDVLSDAFSLLTPNENIMFVFKSFSNDQVIFTNKRIIITEAKGLTLKKHNFSSYPYSKVQNFDIETPGNLDISRALRFEFYNGTSLSFNFWDPVDICQVGSIISQYIL